MRTTRNVLVIVVLAAAVNVLPGAGRAASVLSSLLQMVFLGGLGWFAYRLYREHRVGIFSLGDRMRGLLYASLVVAVLAAASTSRLFQTGGGTAVWFALIIGAIYGLLVVLRVARGG